MQSRIGIIGSHKDLFCFSRPQRRAFVACLDSIKKEYDVKEGAKCLVKAFDGKLEDDFAEAALDPKLNFIDGQDTVPMGKLDIQKIKRRKIRKKIIQKAARSKARKVSSEGCVHKYSAVQVVGESVRRFGGMRDLCESVKRFLKRILVLEGALWVSLRRRFHPMVPYLEVDFVKPSDHH